MLGVIEFWRAKSIYFFNYNDYIKFQSYLIDFRKTLYNICNLKEKSKYQNPPSNFFQVIYEAS